MKRRFIAGAVCPQCGLQDKIVLCSDQKGEVIECVHCDYREHESERTQKSEQTISINNITTRHKQDK